MECLDTSGIVCMVFIPLGKSLSARNTNIKLSKWIWVRFVQRFTGLQSLQWSGIWTLVSRHLRVLQCQLQPENWLVDIRKIGHKEKHLNSLISTKTLYVVCCFTQIIRRMLLTQFNNIFAYFNTISMAWLLYWSELVYDCCTDNMRWK